MHRLFPLLAAVRFSISGMDPLSPTANIIAILTRSYAELKAIGTLPPEFPLALAQQLLTVQACIRQALEKIEQGNFDEYVCTAILPAVLRCQDSASTLRQTLDEVDKWPSSGEASHPYFKLLRTQGENAKAISFLRAKTLMSSLMKGFSMVTIDLESEKAHKSKSKPSCAPNSVERRKRVIFYSL